MMKLLDNPILVLVLILLLVVLIILISSYIKAPPNRAAVISGLSREPRVLIGRAGFRIPYFERVDWLDIGQIDIDVVTEDFIPTSDFINIRVEAVAQVVVDCTEDYIKEAMRNFLNKKPETTRAVIGKSLQGNLREIIGSMELKAICQNKTQFSEKVKENAAGDMQGLGIRIISFNVQNINDSDGLIDDLGIDNRSQIQKDASIAKANADRDVAIAESEARNAADEARVRSEEAIAERNNRLSLKQSELKILEDTKRAEADASYSIQENASSKDIAVKEKEAAIARREKEIELQARQAEVAEKELIANVQKPAEAKKYAQLQEADAELYRRQKEAEANLYEQEKEAEAIRKRGEAEAEAIRLKGEAEADAMDKKAEAMKKYGQAAILEMIVGVLPEMAKSIAEPVSAIDKVTIIGGDSSGVSDVSGNVPAILAKTIESVKEATGFDLTEVLKASTYDAKVNRSVDLSGSLNLQKPEEEEPTKGKDAE